MATARRLPSEADRLRLVIAISATLVTAAFATERAGWWFVTASADLRRHSLCRHTPPGVKWSQSRRWRTLSLRAGDAAVVLFLRRPQ